MADVFLYYCVAGSCNSFQQQLQSITMIINGWGELKGSNGSTQRGRGFSSVQFNSVQRRILETQRKWSFHWDKKFELFSSTGVSSSLFLNVLWSKQKWWLRCHLKRELIRFGLDESVDTSFWGSLEWTVIYRPLQRMHFTARSSSLLEGKNDDFYIPATKVRVSLRHMKTIKRSGWHCCWFFFVCSTKIQNRN